MRSAHNGFNFVLNRKIFYLMTAMKICTRCRQELPFDLFGKNKSKKDGLQTHCKTCRKEINNNHYKNSSKRREAVRRNASLHKIRNTEFLNEVKSQGCCKCGEAELCVLDFHHLGRNKDFDISKKRGSFSIEKLKNELEKCIVVCSNCHRKIHAGVIQE